MKSKRPREFVVEWRADRKSGFITVRAHSKNEAKREVRRVHSQEVPPYASLRVEEAPEKEATP